jgi:hypothetical protein
VARREDRRTVLRDALRGQASLKLPLGVAMEGMVDYDFLQKQLLMWRGRLSMQAQCCGFSLELIEYDYNARKERQFRFSIELANIGSIGNFMGQDSPTRSQGLGGYR